MLKLYPGFNPNIWWGGWTDQGEISASSVNINYVDNGGLGVSVSNDDPYSDQPLALTRVLSGDAANNGDVLKTWSAVCRRCASG